MTTLPYKINEYFLKGRYIILWRLQHRYNVPQFSIKDNPVEKKFQLLITELTFSSTNVQFYQLHHLPPPKKIYTKKLCSFIFHDIPSLQVSPTSQPFIFNPDDLVQFTLALDTD